MNMLPVSLLGCLTKAEEKRKNKLEAAGFSSWKRNHYNAYVAACTNIGNPNNPNNPNNLR